MQHPGLFGRSVVLALSLLSACAAADPSRATSDASGSGAVGAASGDPLAFVAPGAAGYVLTGRFAEQQGDLDYGAGQLLKAVATEPDDVNIRRQAFLAALLANRPQAADLARQLPGNPAAQLLLADIEAMRGNWDAAAKLYESLPPHGVTEILRPLLAAWANFGAGRTDAALGQLHPYTDNERIRGVYTFNDALIADLAGRNADAGRLYKAAEQQFGAPNLDLVRALASWQARQGHADAARQTLAAVEGMGNELAVATPRLMQDVATRPVGSATDGIAEVYLTFAVLLRQQDAPDFANVMLRLALDLRPDLTAARLVAAEVLETDKQIVPAIAVLAPVTAADPLAPAVDMRRASLYDQSGNTAEALRILGALELAYPDRPEPWTLQGSILSTRHQFAEAVAAFTKALALLGPPASGHWPIYYERGVAEERSHQWPKAEADFLEALKLSPGQPEVLNYLGYSWTEQGHDLARAHGMIQHAAEERPNDGAIVDSLGWVELRQGDVTAAVKSLERAVELEPEDPTINGHLGDAYWAAGRKLEAQYQWRRALTMNPEPEDVPRLQAKLHEAEHALATPATATTTTAKAQP